MKKRIALLLCVCLASALILGACANAQAQGLDVVYAGGLEGGTSAAPVKGFTRALPGSRWSFSKRPRRERQRTCSCRRPAWRSRWA